MRRAYVISLLAVPISILASGCTPAPDPFAEAKPNQKRVLVTFPPLYAITHAVAGDDAYVLSMLTGTGPHDYDGAPTDMFMVNKADVLIYNGLTLDDTFVKRMLQTHRNKSLAVLNVGEALDEESDEREKKKLPPLLLANDAEAHAHGEGEMHKHEGHEHGEHDPHVWLGPEQAVFMTKIIAAKLGEIDPDHKKNYDKRAGQFIDELEKLKADGRADLKDKKNKNIVTMHEAFRYFAEGFGVKIVGTIQVRPGEDPDAAKMKSLIELCKKDGVRVIAVEPQYSKAAAESLQKSLKSKGVEVQIITLDPLETADALAGKAHKPDPGYYLKKMRENIATLAKALP